MATRALVLLDEALSRHYITVAILLILSTFMSRYAGILMGKQ
jgi:hypothetical protein